MGGKIVWMPTLAAENHLRWEKTASFAHPASTQKMRHATAVPVLDANKKVCDSRQGSAGRDREERHGAGERPSACQRDLDRVRGGPAPRRQAPHLHASGRHRRRQPQRRQGHRGDGRVGRAFDLHVPGGIEVQGRDRRRPAPSDRGGRRRADDAVFRPRPGRRVLARWKVSGAVSRSAWTSATATTTSTRWSRPTPRGCSGSISRRRDTWRETWRANLASPSVRCA